MPLPQQRGWYHGWNVVAACILVQMSALGLTMNCFSLFLPGWMREFHATASSLALSITLFSFGTAATAYLIGVWSARYTARRVIGAGLVVLAASLFLVSRAEAAWQITAIYIVVMPLALGLTGATPTQALVSRWFLQRSGLPIGLTALGLALGGVIMPPIVVDLLPLVGWRTVWAGMGVFVLVVTLPLALLIMRNRPAADDPAIYARAAEGHQHSAADLTLREILRRPNFWITVYAFLSMLLITMTVAVDISPILGSYGVSAALVGMFLSVSGAAQLAAKLGGGWLADRAGSGLPMILATAMTGVGVLLLTVPQAHPGYLAGVALVMGAAGACWPLAAHAQLSEFGAGNFPRAFALVCMLSPIGTFAPPIVARIYETSGTFAPGLIVLGINALVASVVVMLFYRPRRPAAEPNLA